MKTQYNNMEHSKAFMKALVFMLCAFSITTGCKKFVEIPPPNTQLVTTSVFANNATATSAQLAIYVQMFNANESWNMAQTMGLYADELTNYDTNDGFEIQYYTNELEAVNTPGPWTAYYLYIFYANSVITGLQTIRGTSPAVKNQLMGEAEFVRAFCHFYLTNTYGDVPLVLTTDPNITGKLARTPRIHVLQQVVTDLQSAQNLLNTNYVDGSDTIVTTERVRPNKAAATALLARAYLYLGDYSANSSYYVKADSAASTVIANSNYSLCSSLNAVFLKNSSEAIWQWQTPKPSGVDTYDGANFILLGAPSSGEPNNSTTISPQLLNSFEPNDQRFTNWIGSITEGTTTYYFPYKYKQNMYAGLEYTMVLRLAEQYLIRAEAKAKLGDSTSAEQYLNIIRQRAGLPNYSAASNGPLLNAIQHERQVEFFTEWGHRWFDLERAVAAKLPVNANTVLGSPGNVCQAKQGVWKNSGYQLLFPLPQNDLLNDHNLVQNPGYK